MRDFIIGFVAGGFLGSALTFFKALRDMNHINRLLESLTTKMKTEATDKIYRENLEEHFKIGD